MFVEELKKYLGSKIYIELNSGKYVFGDVTEIENSCLKVRFLDGSKILTIPISSIVCVRDFEKRPK